VQDALGIVIFVVVALAAIVAVASLVHRSRLYDEIGRGAMSIGEDRDRRPGPVASSPAARAEQEEEIRQMLAAQNARRARQGRPPLDVEDELRRLTRGAPDPALREEVRQLVRARNARRERQGKPPLDVEAEVERELREVEGDA
jgi:hypothetical protein